MLDVLEKEDSSNGVDIESYQVFLQRVLSKVDNLGGTYIYTLPSNLHLKIRKTQDTAIKF